MNITIPAEKPAAAATLSSVGELQSRTPNVPSTRFVHEDLMKLLEEAACALSEADIRLLHYPKFMKDTGKCATPFDLEFVKQAQRFLLIGFKLVTQVRDYPSWSASEGLETREQVCRYHKHFVYNTNVSQS